MTNNDDYPPFPIFGNDTPPEERRRILANWHYWHAKRGHVRSARIALESIVLSLQGGLALDEAETHFLVEALQALLANPKNAAAAFGLKQRKGAPSKGSFERRLAGRDVVRLNREHGIPVEDGQKNVNWDGVGAISLIAEARGLSVAQVRRGYSAWLNVLKVHAFDNSSS